MSMKLQSGSLIQIYYVLYVDRKFLLENRRDVITGMNSASIVSSPFLKRISRNIAQNITAVIKTFSKL